MFLHALLQVFLETIDSSSGAASPVGPAIPYEAQAQGLSSMDPKNAVYYLVGYNLSSTKANLCGIDTKTGKLVTDLVRRSLFGLLGSRALPLCSASHA
jgi:hypothetical protein